MNFPQGGLAPILNRIGEYVRRGVLFFEHSAPPMQRALLPFLAILVLVAGGAIWIGRGPGPGPASTGGAGESSAPAGAQSPVDTASQSDPSAEKARSETRKELAPPAAAVEPADPAPATQPDPTQPRPGASVTVIWGGEDAFSEFYRDIPGEGRKSRLMELEGALAEYTDGDPSDPREFQKYQALKDEAEWLRAHIEN